MVIQQPTNFMTYPTDPFTTSVLQTPRHDVSEIHKIRRSPDLEALKLWKDQSGNLEATVHEG